MMHLYLMTRGIKHEVDQFITELQGKYLPFKWRDPNKGKDAPLEDVYVQTSVRPIQLWEIVYPVETQDVILNTILGNREGVLGKPNHPQHDKFLWGIRKVLGVNPIPPQMNKSIMMPIYKENIEVVGIGIKEDYWADPDDPTGKHLKKKEDGGPKTFEAL